MISFDHKPLVPKTLDKTGKTEIGQKIVNSVLNLVFWIEVTTARFHKSGKIPEVMLECTNLVIRIPI